MKRPRHVDEQARLLPHVQLPSRYRLAHRVQDEGLRRLHSLHREGSLGLIATWAVQPHVAHPRRREFEETGHPGVFSLQWVPAVPATPAVPHLRDPGPHLERRGVDGDGPSGLPPGAGNEFIPGQGTALLLARRTRTQKLGMDEPAEELSRVFDAAAHVGATQITKDLR